MKIKLNFLLAFLMLAGICRAQQSVINLPAMYQLIDESKSEHDQQVQARNQQAVNTANEQANLTLLTKLQNIYRTLQQRYNTLGTALSAVNLSVEVWPMVNRIVGSQYQVLNLAEKNPAIIPLGYAMEAEFGEQAESLLFYVTGLMLSIGQVNQMKASDRKLLFDYVISELSHIQELSGNMLTLLQYNNLASVIKALNPFQDFINQDKRIATQIIQNAKYLK